MDNSILITWLIGVILSSILVYIWSILYVGDTKWSIHRIPVNIIIAILYIIFLLTPILNVVHIFVWVQILFACTQKYKYVQLRFPKWMNNTIR